MTRIEQTLGNVRRTPVPNEEIREYAKSKNVRMWEISELFGVSNSYLSVMMRKQFDEERTQQIKDIIDRIANGEPDPAGSSDMAAV